MSKSQIRITSDGTPRGVKITEMVSGVEIQGDVTGVKIEMKPGRITIATITMVRPIVDVVANADERIIRRGLVWRINRWLWRPVARVFGTGVYAEHKLV